VSFKQRKFYIWLVSLGVVLVIYLLYNRLGGTPEIDFRTPAEFTGPVADSNGEVGMIGDVGVGRMEVAEFITRNEKTREIEHIFGFEEVLDEDADIWKISKPYLEIFRPDSKCRITADRGKVRVETIAKRTSPKDATFTGNVVIHILPKKSGRLKESFIYLDDITFISEKSHYSTAGPVKFVSEDAQMLATGLELVYDSRLDRLEFLRLPQLESLRMRTVEGSLFGRAEPPPQRPLQAGRPLGTPAQTSAQQTHEVVAADDSKKQEPPQEEQSPQPDSRPAEQSRGQFYRCVFGKNVVIDTPEQIVFADDELSISNILWSKTSQEKIADADAPGTADTNAPARTAEQSLTAVRQQPDALRAADEKAHTEPAAVRADPQQPSGDFVDVVVTCENGILVTPMDSSLSLKDFAAPTRQTASTGSSVPGGLQDTAERTTLIARKVDYCASAGDTVAAGPLELAFDVNDPAAPGSDETAVPVKVTANKSARFQPALNQVVFEGDVVCTMLREGSDGRQKYTLSGPTLTVDLSDDKASTADIEHLTAAGGVVRLATVKTADKKLLGVVELKCSRFDYDAGRQMFLATGPGVIKVDNSKASEPNSQRRGLSLKRPCWALVQDFETFKYFSDANRIIADAGPRATLRIDYFPVIEGRIRYDRRIIATAAHVEAFLHRTPDGQSELSTLTASGAVTYREQDKQFEGAELFYDAARSMVTVHGDESWPCLLNNVPVDRIEYDLETGEVKAEIVGPGALPIRQ
jgi:hypothetical protein